MWLARETYCVPAAFPDAERFGLTCPIRRCAVGVPSNIAEGAGRGSRKECEHYQRIARGSLMDPDTQCRIARDPGFAGGTAQLHASIQRIAVMPGAHITSKA